MPKFYLFFQLVIKLCAKIFFSLSFSSLMWLWVFSSSTYLSNPFIHPTLVSRIYCGNENYRLIMYHVKMYSLQSTSNLFLFNFIQCLFAPVLKTSAHFLSLITVIKMFHYCMFKMYYHLYNKIFFRTFE